MGADFSWKSTSTKYVSALVQPPVNGTMQHKQTETDEFESGHMAHITMQYE